jgi:type I site-specific restriction endonuclease
MNEAETRKQLIDTKLRLAGWNVHDKTQVVEELDIDLAAAGLKVREGFSLNLMFHAASVYP